MIGIAVYLFNAIIGFVLKHLAMIVTIIVFTLWIDFSFFKLFLFMLVFSAFYEAFLWQFPACIEIRKPIPSTRTNLEFSILSKTISLKKRILYFVMKLIECFCDWKFIAGILIATTLFTIGYYFFIK